MKKGHLKMSAKEIDRLTIIERLINGEIKVEQVSEILNLSTRQVKRLKKRFRDFGSSGLVHKSRGRSGNRKIAVEEVERVLKIVVEQYFDFGPTFALEKLKEKHNVTFGREKLRLAMIEKGIWKVKRRRYVIVHQQRKRRVREGELVQIDGSPYLWFENRGPYCTLLVFVDDATGKLKHLMFAPAETTNNYFRAMDAYIKKFGKPVALYSDKHGVFRVNTRRAETASVDDNNGLTQFGRAMKELGIIPIFANSPQAKGRVEKVNGTLQDRLVKEIRLRNICGVTQGNAYLPEFMDMYNSKFAVCAGERQDAHRPLLSSDKLRDILLTKSARTLSKNLEFSYKNQVYQLSVERPPYAMRHAKIVVLEDWYGNIRVDYKGRKQTFKIAQRLPDLKIVDSKQIYQEVEKAVREPWKPAKNHPWRNYSFN